MFQFDPNLRVARDAPTGILFIDGKFKRTAGRPRIGYQAPVIVISGNTQRGALLSDSTHEILLSNPLIKVLTMLRTLLAQYGILNVTLQFRPQGLYVVEVAEKRNVSRGILSLFFDARYVHHYFCQYPVNVQISRSKLAEAMNVMCNESHYVFMRLQPKAPETPGETDVSLMSFEMRVHINSESLNVFLKSEFPLPVVSETLALHLPPPDEYYPFEFRIANNAFKSFIKDDNGDTIVIKKSITTPMQIFHGRGSELHINIADSSNIVYNHIDPQQMLHVSMPVHLAQTFAQQGDASNHLRIAVHPTDPTVLSYYIENTQFKTQYRIGDDEKIIAAVVRLYIMPKESS